jgi:hypothetical protein
MICHDYDELVEALLVHASGLTGPTGAVVLLAEHRVWLTRTDFRRFIQHGRCHATRRPIAMIRWRAATTALGRDLPCSASEAHMLRIAASLAGAACVRLRDMLGCLDHHNIARIVKAVAIANDTWPIYPQGNQP